MISPIPYLDLPILPTAILALKSRACFKFFSTFPLSHFTESKNFMKTFKGKGSGDLPGFKLDGEHEYYQTQRMDL